MPLRGSGFRLSEPLFLVHDDSVNKPGYCVLPGFDVHPQPLPTKSRRSHRANGSKVHAVEVHVPWVTVPLDPPELDDDGFVAAFEEAVDPQTIVFCDMCIPGYWIAGFRRFTAPRRENPVSHAGEMLFKPGRQYWGIWYLYWGS